MNKTIKRNVIVSAILAIMLCVSLIAGATFALFTSESKVNIAVTSGKVSVIANIDETSVETKQLYDTEYEKGANNMFEGVATFNEEGLTLEKFVPGDGIKFNIVVKNESNVTVQYRTIISCENDDGLFEGLDITVGDNENYNGVTLVSDWAQLAVGVDDAIVPVSIELPEGAGNEYQEKTCTISYKVEAVQGNAKVENPKDDTIYVYNANDLKALSGKYLVGNNGKAEIQNVELMADVDLKGAEFKEIGVAYGDTMNFYGNGHTVSNVQFVTGSHDGLKSVGMFFVATDATLNVEKLTLDTVVVKDGYTYDGSIGVAAVIGYANGNSTVNLTDVDVKNANINNTFGNAAVLVGYATSTVTMTDCDVTDSTASGEIEDGEVRKDKTGAFFGTANSSYVYTLVNCTNNTELNIAGRVINGATLKVDGKYYVTTADGFTSLMKGSESEVNIILADGKYENVLTASNKTINVVGENKNGAEIALTKALSTSHDHLGLGGCTVTLKNVKATFEDDCYYAAYINNPTMTYIDCTIIGQQYIYGNTSFIGCTFDNDDEAAISGMRYTYIYDGDVVVDNCDFYTQGHGLIMFKDQGVDHTLTVRSSRFHGGAGRTAYAVANQNTAAIEIDGSCGANYTLILEGKNTFDEGFSGLWRIKAMKEGVTTTVNETGYSGTSADVYLDGVRYTKDANRNVAPYPYYYFSDGLYTDAEGNFYVYNANGLDSLNTWLHDTTDSSYNQRKAFWGKSYNIIADIDATGKTWKTFKTGMDSADSNGIVFNGNGYTISNLTIEGNGLFTGATQGTTEGTTATVIKNVTFDNVTVNGTSHHNGLVWGEVIGSITLEKVNVVNSKVSGGCNVGGLVGRNSESHATIKFVDCSVKKTTVTATTVADYAGASAFLGNALHIGTSCSANVIFEGNNVAEENTLTSAKGLTGGGIYTKAEWGATTWETPDVVNAFEDYNSNNNN